MAGSSETIHSGSKAGGSVLPRSPETALWVIIASGTLTVMAGAILGPVVNGIQTGLGVSGSLAGLIITTHGLFIVLASPVAGSLIDRYGPRRPYILGLVLYAFSGGAGLVVGSFELLLVSRAFLGVAVAFVYTSITVLIYNLFEGERKDRVMGLRGSANSLGAAVWPLAGGVLGTVSWHLPFGVYVLALPLGVLAYVTVPEPAMAAAPDDGDRSADGMRGIARVFLDTPVLPFVYGLYFATNALLYTITIYYPQLLSGFGISSSFTISLYLAALGVAGGASAYFYDRIKRRFDYRQLTLAALVLWSIGFGIAGIASTPVPAVLPVVLFGLGQGLVFPTVLLWVEELVPADKQGQFSSYVAMAGYIGQFLSPVLFGVVAGPFGVRGVFVAAALFAGVALVATGVRYAASSSA
ncbi:MFS transporter [Halococcus sp. IIIV-5B]|uniref:MFS transporter n=1 Tax=Halococcus sp. IIIV-5B TaxID=2321230 RepID=UPI000E76FA94|nr:MFS transporter [Halococcus sp. IIIV-5B]RJT08056.1 MFS transporter [Halococcus sp. IIIV-5B]